MTIHIEQKKLSMCPRSLDDLGPDLEVEILHRLPHKDVIRCKCISRQWLDFISSLNFVYRFLSMKKQLWTFMSPLDETDRVHGATFLDSILGFPRFSLSFLPKQFQGKEPICVIKTFNDLLLCCRRKRFQWVYFICNPLTMQWVVLPPSPYCYEYVCVDFTCYKKDSTTQLPNGVAIDTQYWCKVVKIVASDYATQLNLEIFSSETGKWVKTEVPILNTNNDIFSYIIQDAITFDGNLTCFGFVEGGTKNIIISTNVEDGFREANMIVFGSYDDSWRMSPCGPSLTVTQGHLRLAWITKSISVPILKIWELKQCQLSLVHEVNFTVIVSENEWISKHYLKSIFGNIMEEGHICFPIVLGLDPNDKNIVYLNLIYCDSMAKYDIRTRTLNLVPESCIASFAKLKEDIFQMMLPLRPTMVPQLLTPN